MSARASSKASAPRRATVTGSKPRRLSRGYGATVKVTIADAPEHQLLALRGALASVPPGSPIATLDEAAGEVRYRSDSSAEVETAWRSGRDLAKLRLRALGYVVGGSAT